MGFFLTLLLIGAPTAGVWLYLDWRDRKQEELFRFEAQL